MQRTSGLTYGGKAVLSHTLNVPSDGDGRAGAMSAVLLGDGDRDRVPWPPSYLEVYFLRLQINSGLLTPLLSPSWYGLATPARCDAADYSALGDLRRNDRPARVEIIVHGCCCGNRGDNGAYDKGGITVVDVSIHVMGDLLYILFYPTITLFSRRSHGVRCNSDGRGSLAPLLPAFNNQEIDFVVLPGHGQKQQVQTNTRVLEGTVLVIRTGWNLGQQVRRDVGCTSVNDDSDDDNDNDDENDKTAPVVEAAYY